MVNLLAHLPDHVGATLLLAEDGPIAGRAHKEGIALTVLGLSSTRLVRRTERNPLRVLGSVLGLLRSAGQLRAALREQPVDLVVAVGTKAIVYALPAARLTRTKVVWSFHDRASRDYFASAFVPVLRHVLPRLVDGVMVNSRSTLATIRPGRTPALVAYPGTTHPCLPQEPARDEVGRVLMLGRLTGWKGQDLFLRAFARVFGGTSVTAHVVGGALFGESGYETGLRALAVDLAIADQVHFAGHLSDPWPELVAADVLVHASRVPEPFGQVVVQGLAAGCAVVATRPGGPAEVIDDHVDGLLVPTDDEDALVAALTELRDDRPLRRRLVDAAPGKAATFDIERTAPNVGRWLASVAAGTVSRGPTCNLPDH